MIRFITRLSIFVALQLAILGFVVQRGVRYSENTYLAAMHDKLDRLESLSEPRLIIVGGSNGAFGIHSEVVAEGIPQSPVNLSLHAALGIDFYLRLVEDHVRAGDTVILIPEYELADRTINEKSRTQMKLACPELSQYLSNDPSKWEKIKAILDRDSLITLHSFSHCAFQRKPNHETAYRRSGFNEFGDLTAHYELPAEHINERSGIAYKEKKVEKFINRLNQFGDACHQAGAKVYLSFVPVNRGRFEDSRQGIQKFEDAYRARLNFPVLDRPEEYVFDDALFYDTFYHLNREGGEQRSRIMNQALRRQLVAEQADERVYR